MIHIVNGVDVVENIKINDIKVSIIKLYSKIHKIHIKNKLNKLIILIF